MLVILWSNYAAIMNESGEIYAYCCENMAHEIIAGRLAPQLSQGADMAKKPQAEQWYAIIVKKHTPQKSLGRNCLVAFLGGGALCALSQAALFCLINYAGMAEKNAISVVLTGVIFLTALFTGLGVYDKAGQKLGAGLAVPISGFANSVAASMMEHRSEGYVLGSGCNSFKLAGAVVVFGILSAFGMALVLLILGLA
jgi:stage V sporulation protein AC